MSFVHRAQPQVNLPQGCISLPVDREQLVPFLDRILRESLGMAEPPAKTAAVCLQAIPRLRESPHPKPRAPARALPPDHHLWKNNGTWFAVYTIYPTPITKERVRESLQTRCVVTARRRRDERFAQCEVRGILATRR